MIKTFRGLLADGAQDRIRLQTIKGKVGYRIIKYQLFPSQPGAANYEATVQVWKEKQSSVSTSAVTVDFTDSALLAASVYIADAGYAGNNNKTTTVFDNEIFNQDIYVSHTGTSGASAINYYLELEVIPLDDAGAEYTTLKDMRST